MACGRPSGDTAFMSLQSQSVLAVKDNPKGGWSLILIFLVLFLFFSFSLLFLLFFSLKEVMHKCPFAPRPGTVKEMEKLENRSLMQWLHSKTLNIGGHKQRTDDTSEAKHG